jgi:NAD(P)-dependent dehydrogenase (short-subunit alcohol dehydrogenase family)
MTVRLKPIKEQVIVITGASSGIGLVTARMAAKRGARVMLTARNHDALKQLADEIVANGTEAWRLFSLRMWRMKRRCAASLTKPYPGSAESTLG